MRQFSTVVCIPAVFLFVSSAHADERDRSTDIEAVAELMRAGGCVTVRTTNGRVTSLKIAFNFGCHPIPPKKRAGKKPPRKFKGLLAALPHLTSLDLSGGRSNLTEENIQAIGSLRQLAILDISHAEQVRDESLKHLKLLKKLRSVSLGNGHMTGIGLAHLKDIPLLSLNIQGGISDDGLKAIGAIRSLRYLQITPMHNSKLTAAGIAHLANLADLETLRFFDYRRQQVTDKSVVHLTKCRKLRDLNLHSTALTDKCVPQLLKMKQLEVLRLPPAISREATRRLIDGLPKTKVHNRWTVNGKLP